MKVKGVFFDWGFTLAHPEPDRHIQFYQGAKELGVILPLDGLLKAIHEADNQVPAGAPPRYRKDKEEAPFLRWWEVLLSRIGGDLPRDVKLGITRLACNRIKKTKWVLYDDVLPTVKKLKKRGLIVGLISNISMSRAELETFLDVEVTAKDIGVGKPAPIIFLTALKLAEVTASEAIHVGDQYEVDVVGARGVGINPIIIDRYNLTSPAIDCPYIRSLSELTKYV